MLKGSCVYRNCATRVLEDWYTPQEIADLLEGGKVLVSDEDDEDEYEFIEGDVLTF